MQNWRVVLAVFNPYLTFSSSSSGSIEIPLSLLPCSLRGNQSHFSEFATVEALDRVDYGSRVLVDPLTTEDWELLEIHSQAMEYGGLLNQISVVYLNQMLELSIGTGNDVVRMAVKETESGSFASMESSVWPEMVTPALLSSGEDDGKSSQTPPCVLMMQDTEVVIAPKPRAQKKTASWSSPLRLLPSDEDWGEVSKDLSDIVDVRSFSVAPSCVLVNTDQWPYKNVWARIRSSKSSGKNASERVVRVVAVSDVPMNQAGTSC